jgi:hypothetical protein
MNAWHLSFEPMPVLDGQRRKHGCIFPGLAPIHAHELRVAASPGSFASIAVTRAPDLRRMPCDESSRLPAPTMKVCDGSSGIYPIPASWLADQSPEMIAP